MVIRILVILVVVAALGLGLWWYESYVRDMVEPEPETRLVEEPPPQPRYPVPVPEPIREPGPDRVVDETLAPEPEPLPALEESDEPI
ncbi:MAG: hypothetical protein ACNA7J_13215, partial [Wenzhouxiangella sp.]